MERLLPLAGLRVVALEQAVSAPFCSRQLADLGADVIKVERPDGGDTARGYDGALRGLSAYFAWLNRGKRSVVLDLKAERDRAACAQLIGRADVFVHNLAPGAVERLAFGYDDLAAQHPRLVWCSISGYGRDGPWRDVKAYDMLVQAESGVVSVTGSPDSPAKVGISIADIAAGMYGYSSILTALYARERTGRGDRIDISMLECLAEWMMPPLYVWQGTGTAPARAGVRHNMIVPYGAYACADGMVMFAVQHDREWRRLCTGVLGQPALADDPRFATNAERLAHRVELEGIIEDAFRVHPREAVRAKLRAADIPTATLNDVPALAAHPQLAARQRWTTVDGPFGTIPALIPPHNLGSVSASMGAVPSLGEHTESILAELSAGADRSNSRDGPVHALNPSPGNAMPDATAASRPTPSRGRCYEDFDVGMVLRHPIGRTITSTDNTWFTLLTVNTNPIHFDAHYAAQTEFGRPVVDSTFTLALVTGLSVADVSQYAVNLGWAEVRMPAPVFEGDTIYAQSEVLSKRESASRPAMGIVEVKSTGFKQDGTVVMEFRRTILVYKRGHEPQAPLPSPSG